MKKRDKGKGVREELDIVAYNNVITTLDQTSHNSYYTRYLTLSFAFCLIITRAAMLQIEVFHLCLHNHITDPNGPKWTIMSRYMTQTYRTTSPAYIVWHLAVTLSQCHTGLQLHRLYYKYLKGMWLNLSTGV